MKKEPRPPRLDEWFEFIEHAPKTSKVLIWPLDWARQLAGYVRDLEEIKEVENAASPNRADHTEHDLVERIRAAGL
jgi:hypothetical protein